MTRSPKGCARARAASLDQVQARAVAEPAACAAALNHLAHAGQVIYDLTAGLYRWRQVMPMAIGEAEIGPENAELAASRDAWSAATGSHRIAAGGTPRREVYIGKAEGKPVELLVDADGTIRRG